MIDRGSQTLTQTYLTIAAQAITARPSLTKDAQNILTSLTH